MLGSSPYDIALRLQKVRIYSRLGQIRAGVRQFLSATGATVLADHGQETV
jgi:hypothetical protein